jgi:hypothetical protein
MAVLVDLQCSVCGRIRTDAWSDLEGIVCQSGKAVHTGPAKNRAKQPPPCNGIMERIYTLTRGPDPGTHPSEKVVLYKSAKEGGRVQWPGRNDVDIPDRLKRRGYERIEFNVRDLAAVERKYNVVNERRHYDKGNGPE